MDANVEIGSELSVFAKALGNFCRVFIANCYAVSNAVSDDKGAVYNQVRRLEAEVESAQSALRGAESALSSYLGSFGNRDDCSRPDPSIVASLQQRIESCRCRLQTAQVHLEHGQSLARDINNLLTEISDHARLGTTSIGQQGQVAIDVILRAAKAIEYYGEL